MNENETSTFEPTSALPLDEAEACTEPVTAEENEQSGCEGSEAAKDSDDLRKEIARLTEELTSLREQHAKTAAEVSEFHELFPEMSLSSLPDSVWDAVKSGSSLCASVALYEKKREMAAARAASVNRQNAARSPGLAGKDASPEYFTPDEVRAMTPAEVRRHYGAICRSMPSWKA